MMKRSIPQQGSSGDLPNRWALQNAKTHFSELVRRVKCDGTQHVTVHGRDEVVVISVDDFVRLSGSETGQSLIDALQSSPFRDLEIEPRREAMPIRDGELRRDSFRYRTGRRPDSSCAVERLADTQDPTSVRGTGVGDN
jgi:prevent-host-death family protein